MTATAAPSEPPQERDHDPRRIRQLRRARGLNQRQLAELANVANGTISNAENPDYEAPLSVRTLSGIARALHVPIAEIMRQPEQDAGQS